MDHFGIGTAVKGAVLTYITASRRTGRTTSLVDSLKDGDTVVFQNFKEGERVRRLCLERGVKVKCEVVDAKHSDLGRLRRNSGGRMLFDHGWVEEFYMRAIEGATKEIDAIQAAFSRDKSEEEPTLRAKLENAKWEYID